MICNEASIVEACRGKDPSKSVIQVAKACNVQTHGLSQYWPFSEMGINRYTCARLFAVNTNALLRKNMDQQALDFFGTLGNLPLVKKTEYEGFIHNGIFALLYLLKRNHRECVVLTDFNKVLQRLLKNTEMTMEELDWSHFSIMWSPDTEDEDPPYSIKVPGGNIELYGSQITQCMRHKKARFFLSLVTLCSFDMATFHANVLFYDQETGLLERFDPFQSQFKGYKSKQFDIELQSMFKKIYPGGYKGMIHPPDMSNLQRQGLQLKAEQEGEKHPDDPRGFCLPWSLMYADARLTLPNQDPSSLPELFQIMASEHKLSLTRFIRNYAENFEEVNWKVYMDFLKKYPTYKQFKDPLIPMYALFLKQLSEYAAFYT
jgi:hypothetical protein